MAARRLLIVMLILLGLSTLAAALIPPQSLREDSTSTTTTTSETIAKPLEPAPGGGLFAQSITVSKKRIPVVPIRVGDELLLTVRSRVADQLEIPALGLVQAVAPNAPAHFDILAQESGSYGVRLVLANRLAARVEVLTRGGKKAKSRARAEPGSA